MKRTAPIAPFLFFVLILSACKKYYGCDEELDCQRNEPSKGEARVRVSIPEASDSVRLEIRQGTWKEGRIVQSGPISQPNSKVRLSLNQRYTAEATYATQGDSLRAYDSGRLDLVDRKNCGAVCYQVKELILDLRRADR
jgi:hypothetical protein